MKKIDLPITQSFASRPIDMHQARADLESGNATQILISTIDFGECSKIMEQARINGGKVIWSTTCLEQKLEHIITQFLFPESSEVKSIRKRFFSHKIMSTNSFSFSSKKVCVSEILNEAERINGKTKDLFAQSVKKVMDYRNAFAHGELSHEDGKGCILEHWIGQAQRDVLDDDYWDKLTEWFSKAHEVADYIKNAI